MMEKAILITLAVLFVLCIRLALKEAFTLLHVIQNLITEVEVLKKNQP